MTWYAHRRSDGTVASIHSAPQEGYAEEELADDDPAVTAIMDTMRPNYRERRKAAYADQLGVDKGDVVNTLGDVIDAIIKHLYGNTVELDAMVQKIAAIKAAHPKPE